MQTLINRTLNFRERRVSVQKAITILGKNGIQVDEEEATTILGFLYQIAKTFKKTDYDESIVNLDGKSNTRKAAE